MASEAYWGSKAFTRSFNERVAKLEAAQRAREAQAKDAAAIFYSNLFQNCGYFVEPGQNGNFVKNLYNLGDRQFPPKNPDWDFSAFKNWYCEDASNYIGLAADIAAAGSMAVTLYSVGSYSPVTVPLGTIAKVTAYGNGFAMISICKDYIRGGMAILSGILKGVPGIIYGNASAQITFDGIINDL